MEQLRQLILALISDLLNNPVFVALIIFSAIVALLYKARDWGARILAFILWMMDNWVFILVGLGFLALLPLCGGIVIANRAMFCDLAPIVCIVTPTSPTSKVSLPPQSAAFPVKATPRSVKTGVPPLVIDFLIDRIDFQQTSVTFNITVVRSADKPLSWNSERGRQNEIYLQGTTRRYNLLDMGGLFTQNTTLQPRQSYTGWLLFEKPAENTVTFTYPDVESVLIDLSTVTPK